MSLPALQSAPAPARDYGPAAGHAVGYVLATAPDLGDLPLDQAFEQVYRELKRLAHRALARVGGATLCTTGLVHEAYMKLAGHQALGIGSRRHFFALCARAMRQIVIDHARRRHADKRGSGLAPLPLPDHHGFDPARPESLVALDAALTALERHSPRLVELLQLRLFAGLELDEIAPMFGVTVRQLQRDWQRARLWLFQALLPESGGD